MAGKILQKEVVKMELELLIMLCLELEQVEIILAIMEKEWNQMKTLIDVLAALSDFVKVASEWAESASKAEVETFTQIYPQKEETVKKAVEKPVTL